MNEVGVPVQLWEDRIEKFPPGHGKHYDVTWNWTKKEYREETVRVAAELFEGDSPIIGPGDGKRMIDYGCGFGRYAPHFLKAGWKYLGVDLLRKVLVEAKRQQPQATFLLSGEPVADPLSPALLFCSLFLQHLTDVQALELFARIRSERIVIVDDTNADSGYVKKRSGGQLCQLVHDGGWTACNVRYLSTKKSYYKIVYGGERK